MLRLLAALALLAPPVACTSWQPKSTAQAPARADQAPAQTDQTPARADQTPAQADQAYVAGAAALREGAVERALENFAEAWRLVPGHAGVAAEYPVALGRLKKSADEAYRQGSFEEAGRKWAAAARHLGHPAARDNAPDFTRADLKAAMDRASTALMERGLLEYRQGHLEAAIATWKSILAFDPAHEDAAKSVRTATTQLENLKKLPPAK